MTRSTEQRMAENEVVFRTYNDSIRHRAATMGRAKSSLLFYCECSDEDCTEQISLEPAVYEQVHRNTRQFTIVCGHETPTIERIVSKQQQFCIVEKFETPNPDNKTLHNTPLNNT